MSAHILAIESSRTWRSTAEGEGDQPTFAGVTFEVPFPRIQVPGTNDFDGPPSPGNCESGEDRQWQANSVDRDGIRGRAGVEVGVRTRPDWGITCSGPPSHFHILTPPAHCFSTDNLI